MSAFRRTNVQSGVVVGGVGQTFSTLLNYNSPQSTSTACGNRVSGCVCIKQVGWKNQKSAEQLYLYQYIQAI